MSRRSATSAPSTAAERMADTTVLISFGHPLADAAQKAAEQLLRAPLTVVHIPTHIGADDDVEGEARRLVDAVGFTSTEWQVRPSAIILPGHSVLAAAVLAEIHGRSGNWPRTLRLRRGADGTYHPASILDLQHLRDDARGRRMHG